MASDPQSFEEIEFYLSRQIDGDLSPEEAARLEHLLAERGDARSDLDRLRRVDDLVRRWGRGELPVDWDRFRQQVVQRATDQPIAEPRARVVRLVRLFAPAAAAAAVVILTVVYWGARVSWQDSAPDLQPVVQVAFHRPAGEVGAGGPAVVVRFDRSAPAQDESTSVEPWSFAAAVAVGAPRPPGARDVEPSPFF